jgi:2-polyprenyl-3-methyl-5-hydroxy-6-metoxy-1,4-benzoquinol methylase
MHHKEHWNRVYSDKATESVSWFQHEATQSLHFIEATGVPLTAAIIDVGGGSSTLTDSLLAAGYRNLTVLDLSSAALAVTRTRLGERSASVNWIEADITQVELPLHAYDVWHDRAVFHFLITPEAREAYVSALLRALKPGGHVIIATFAEDGPTECSGLPVIRYRAEELHAELGPPFELIRHEHEDHYTPFGTTQKFVYCYCRKAES